MRDTIETIIPGRASIELVAFYDEFRSYYPLCELETKRWFVENVQPDWWIFDIGANVGYYSILFAQLAPRGRVVSFEPTSTVQMLRANLSHNSIANVDVHQVALGATTGVHQDRIFRLWGGDGDVGEYSFYRFDDFVAEHQPSRIDCLKIDVDSFDFEVLRGAEQTLRKYNPTVVIELNHALSKRNQSAGEALAWLARLGYREALVLDHDNFVLQRERSHPDADVSLNLLFPAPMRFDESLDAVLGREAAVPLHFASIHNGSASTTQDSLESRKSRRLGERLRAIGSRLLNREKPPVLSALIGKKIATSEQIWSYALVLTPPTDWPSVGTDNKAIYILEVSVEVFEGKLGVAIENHGSSGFATPERVISAAAGIQRVLITVAADQIHSMVFRTVAPEGTRTVFALSGLRAKIKPVSG